MTTLLHAPHDIPWPTTHYEELNRLSRLYPVSNMPAMTRTSSDRGGNTGSTPNEWLYHMLLNSSSSSTSTSPSSTSSAPSSLPSTSSTPPSSTPPSSVSSSSPPYWFTHKPLFDALQGPLTWVACHYILNVKLPITSSIKPQYNSNNFKAPGMQQDQHQPSSTPSSMVMRLPLDPVARFHLKNGASFHQVVYVYTVTTRYKVEGEGRYLSNSTSPTYNLSSSNLTLISFHLNLYFSNLTLISFHLNLYFT